MNDDSDPRDPLPLPRRAPAVAWSAATPAICPKHGNTLVMPAECSRGTHHCLLCLLEASELLPDELCNLAGCFDPLWFDEPADKHPRVTPAVAA